VTYSEPRRVAGRIDFARSKAHLPGHTIPWGFVYLNRKGRDPNGFVDEKDVEEVASELAPQLKYLSRDIGREIHVDVFRSNEVFLGRKSSLGSRPPLHIARKPILDGWKAS